MHGDPDFALRDGENDLHTVFLDHIMEGESSLDAVAVCGILEALLCRVSFFYRR